MIVYEGISYHGTRLLRPSYSLSTYNVVLYCNLLIAQFFDIRHSSVQDSSVQHNPMWYMLYGE